MFTLVVVCSVCAYLLWQYLKWKKKFRNIPQPPSVPILGHLFLCMGSLRSMMSVLAKLRTEYKRMLLIWYGPIPNVLLYDPNDVEVVIKASRNMEKSSEYDMLRPWLGDSILISNGTKFRQNKKILVKTFHLNNLKSYMPIINANAQKIMEELDSEVGKEEFNVDHYLNMYTMFNLLETSLGVSKEVLGKEAIDYGDALEKIGRYAFIRGFKIWLRPEIIFKFTSLKKKQDKCLEVLNNLTNRVIHQRKREYEERLRKQEKIDQNEDGGILFLDNFFSSVKENGDFYNEEEIRDEVMTIMFAGQDTTTVTVGFALSLLGIHEKVQDKLYNELFQVFGHSQREVAYDDLKELKYMEQVIQETWRLFPPIPIIGKKCTEDIQLEGCTIPKNTTMMILIMLLHRNEEIFPNPDDFNPDHFLPEKVKERHPYSFIPFSSGYRKCIGPLYAMIVVKVLLSTILRKYWVSSKVGMMDYKLSPQTTLKRKDGFRIALHRREIKKDLPRG